MTSALWCSNTRLCPAIVLQCEVSVELFGHSTVRERHVLGQPVLERGIGLALDQGRQIRAARGGDVEPVCADKRARQRLFLVSDCLEGGHPDSPCVGLIGDRKSTRLN